MRKHGAQSHSAASEQRSSEITACAEATQLVKVIHPSSSHDRLVPFRSIFGHAARALARRPGVLLRISAMLCPGLLALASCADLGQEFKNFQRGWRTAEVVAVGRADQIENKGYTDCRRTADAAERQTSRYAALTYRLGQRQHWHIVKVSPDVAISPGDVIVANVESCELPVYPLPQVPPGSP